ncbi:neuroglian-like [Condylostylus longicornis]|uniref:neuroglian-like n=1 Tax=Condylostylus longicornis TaxID=2530218 RepID=UPI00244D9E3E|nr:neuroglian-like [Condylostylus longicornis]
MGRQIKSFAVVLVALLGTTTALNREKRWPSSLDLLENFHYPFLINSPPKIIKQPPTDELLFKVAQQSKESDKPFLIECEAEGNPDPQMQTP